MPYPTVHVVVSAVIENSKGEILLAKRSPNKSYPNLWEDVGGGVEVKEKPEDALLREIKEETGITDIEIIKPLTVFHFFHDGMKDEDNEILGISYWCKTNTDKVTLSDEHCDYKWLAPEEAITFPIHKALKKLLREVFVQEKALKEKIDSISLR